MLRDGFANAAIGLSLLAAIFIPLERAFTARRQRLLRPEWAIDFAFFAFQYLVMAGAILAANRYLQLRFGALGPDALVVAVQRLPLPAQVGIAVLLGDLGLYGAHRLSHEVPLLWRFHAVHHSVERLDWLAAHREHPLDGLYSQVFLNLPAFVLGVDLTLAAPFFVLRGLWAIFIHSNVTLPLGPLGWLLGDPVLHRWHHAKVERCRHNFANLAPYLDLLFGTHHRPADESYVLGGTGASGRGFLHQLVRPFLPEGSLSLLGPALRRAAGQAVARARKKRRATV
jgi:sterol desaturase/sphingolipid hydroxylase (fatty acid hydroxylase superfamily)